MLLLFKHLFSRTIFIVIVKVNLLHSSRNWNAKRWLGTSCLGQKITKLHIVIVILVLPQFHLIFYPNCFQTRRNPISESFG